MMFVSVCLVSVSIEWDVQCIQHTCIKSIRLFHVREMFSYRTLQNTRSYDALHAVHIRTFIHLSPSLMVCVCARAMRWCWWLWWFSHTITGAFRFSTIFVKYCVNIGFRCVANILFPKMTMQHAVQTSPFVSLGVSLF